MSLREEGDDSRCFPYLLLIHCSQRYDFIRFTPQVFTLIHKMRSCLANLHGFAK